MKDRGDFEHRTCLPSGRHAGSVVVFGPASSVQCLDRFEGPRRHRRLSPRPIVYCRVIAEGDGVVASDRDEVTFERPLDCRECVLENAREVVAVGFECSSGEEELASLLDLNFTGGASELASIPGSNSGSPCACANASSASAIAPTSSAGSLTTDHLRFQVLQRLRLV